MSNSVKCCSLVAVIFYAVTHRRQQEALVLYDVAVAGLKGVTTNAWFIQLFWFIFLLIAESVRMPWYKQQQSSVSTLQTTWELGQLILLLHFNCSHSPKSLLFCTSSIFMDKSYVSFIFTPHISIIEKQWCHSDIVDVVWASCQAHYWFLEVTWLWSGSNEAFCFSFKEVFQCSSLC